MKTLEFSQRLISDINKSKSFSDSLARLRDGKEATPRSWVYESEENPDMILKHWETILSNADGDLKFITDWDLSKRDKFAAQGAVAPFSKRQDTLKEYWEHLADSPLFKSSDWKKAKAAAARHLGFNQSGKPRPVEAIVERGLSEDKYNTSSGDPLFKKRKSPEAISQAIQAVHDGSWSQYYPVLGSRATMGKTGEAARWIFMFPMSVNLYEQTFQQPLQDYIRERSVPFFTPWDGYDKVQTVLSSIKPNRIFFGCDYSKMDQHFNFYHAKECYDVIKLYFQPSYWNDLLSSITYTFHCDVVAPDYLIAGPHALPSGSGWTNFLETMFNYILTWYFRIHYGLDIEEETSMGIGDDQIWFLEDDGRDLTKLADFVVKVFKECGLDANPEKQEVSRECISFLQRHSYTTWSPQGVKYAGVYPTVRALTSEVFPEFYHNEKEWTKNTFALRCLMILENCQYHPKFEEFCIYIAKGNANIVEFALSDDAAILLERQKSKKIANFLPTYNQAKIELDPTKFESLKIIRSHFKK